MKNITTILILLFTTISFGQIINITDKDGTRTTGAYYKDVNNLLDQYEGTWLYTNVTDSLKIVLVKKTNQYNGRYYEDLIIGEYQYIENGVEKINTLSEINTVFSNQRRHSISGNSLIKKTSKPPCNECLPNEKRLSCGFEDEPLDLYGYIIIRKSPIAIEEQETIKVKIRMEGSGSPWLDGTPPPPLDFNVPSGEYILIKQP
jgi:hypothetical protein